MSNSLLETLVPEFGVKVANIIVEVSDATNMPWQIIQGRRTIAEQNKLYDQGRSAAGSIVTNAKGGQSAHNYGLAADCVPLKDGKAWWDAPASIWRQYGDIATAQGLTWGGNFKSIHDVPHIESPAWKEQRDLWINGKITVA